MGPVVRLHHSDEVPTAVLENTEGYKERSRVKGKAKVGDWRVIFESRFLAPEVSGSLREKFYGTPQRGVGPRLQECQNLHQLQPVSSGNFFRRTAFIGGKEE